MRDLTTSTVSTIMRLPRLASETKYLLRNFRSSGGKAIRPILLQQTPVRVFQIRKVGWSRLMAIIKQPCRQLRCRLLSMVQWPLPLTPARYDEWSKKYPPSRNTDPKECASAHCTISTKVRNDTTATTASQSVVLFIKAGCKDLHKHTNIDPTVHQLRILGSH